MVLTTVFLLQECVCDNEAQKSIAGLMIMALITDYQALLAPPNVIFKSPPIENSPKSIINLREGFRDTMDLSGDWDFTYTMSHEQNPPLKDVFHVTMQVPGCWDDVFELNRAKHLWPQARFNPVEPLVNP